MESNLSKKENICKELLQVMGLNEVILIQAINAIQAYLKTLSTSCSNNKKPRSMTWVC